MQSQEKLDRETHPMELHDLDLGNRSACMDGTRLQEGRHGVWMLERLRRGRQEDSTVSLVKEDRGREFLG